MLKAIETVYNGYRFRSRLEARWAVFFDRLGIAYQYEIEGFDLGEAGWYLPDFYLTQYSIYAEIKPALNLITPIEQLKIDTMVKIIISKWENLIEGEVAPPMLLILLTETPDVPWQESEGSGSVRSLMYELDIPWKTAKWTHLISEAVKAARQARFEHGEMSVGVR